MDVTAIQASPDATGPETGLLLAVWWLPFRAVFARLARVLERLARRPVSSRSRTEDQAMQAEAQRLFDERTDPIHSARGTILMDEDRVDGVSGHEECLLTLRVRYLESDVARLRRELAELRVGLVKTEIRVTVIEGSQARELGRLRPRVAALDLAVFG